MQAHLLKRNLKIFWVSVLKIFPFIKQPLTHRSVREGADENNERLEYLGDAVLSALVADYLFKRYPYKEEGFLN